MDDATPVYQRDDTGQWWTMPWKTYEDCPAYWLFEDTGGDPKAPQAARVVPDEETLGKIALLDLAYNPRLVANVYVGGGYLELPGVGFVSWQQDRATYGMGCLDGRIERGE